MRYMRFRVALAACAIAISGNAAQAHSPIKGLGVFYSHFLDPLFAPAHGLVILATALMLGQQGRAVARVGFPVFAACFALGLTAIVAGFGTPVGDRGILALAAAIGASVSLAHKLPIAMTTCAAGVAGVLLGLDTESDGSNVRETMLMCGGLTAGVLFLLTLGAGLTLGLAPGWKQIGVRIVGSWIVAASTLALALALAPVSKRKPIAVAPVIELRV